MSVMWVTLSGVYGLTYECAATCEYLCNNGNVDQICSQENSAHVHLRRGTVRVGSIATAVMKPEGQLTH